MLGRPAKGVSAVADAIVFYGADWCPDCLRSKRYLEHHGVVFRFVDTDADPGANEAIRHLQGGRERIPTIVFPDGSFLVEPSNSQLSSKLQELGLLVAS
ncbi:MAG TPA: glutaredoxin domain-containing protein [Armatimonadota bacterium]|nr:glutaredoxin domain-containing protein [Armatimonadota bacterium]